MIARTDSAFPAETRAASQPVRSADSTATPWRFTIDGSDELETRLARACDTILAGIRALIPAPRLHAVLLGGGYGRGEGGVLQTDAGERPYNDLEFYVGLRGNRHLNERRYHQSLEVLGEILTPMVGVAIEFKIIALAEFQRSRISMFSYDLLMGHRRLWGDADWLLDLGHHRIAGDIPSSEATRLLMNRCSGLLFAQERLERPEFTAADADFVQRNLAKAELALGDAVLTSHGLYHWSCDERNHRLQRLHPEPPLAWLDNVRRRHAAGVQFKLHPARSTASRADLRAHHADVVALGLHVWLWQESRRLGVAFISARDYAGSGLDKCPETSRGRNVLVNLKTGGPQALLAHDPFRHPRERVLGDLCSLLWAPPTHSPAPRADHRERANRVASYHAHWVRVN